MPAYSMGKQKKDAAFILKNLTPGVGAYQTNNWKKQSRIKTSPSVAMTRTNKFFSTDQKTNERVSPFTYSPKKISTAPMYSVKGRIQNNYSTGTPSPLNYHIQSSAFFPSKQYSFGKSVRKIKTEQGPGPANNTFQVTSSTPAFSFTKQEKHRLLMQKIPGPGAYNFDKLTKDETPEFSFKKERKFIQDFQEQKLKGKIPGPGAYSIGEFKKKFKGGKFAYGQKMSILNKSQGPGPGSYSVLSTCQLHGPKATIGSDKRDHQKIETIPGPNAYQIPKPEVYMKKQGAAIFTQQNKFKRSSPSTPGPGSYNSINVHESRAHSITARHTEQNHERTPGPQNYNPEYKAIQNRMATTSFGNQPRLKSAKSQAPGPGQYKLDSKTFNKTFCFAKEKRVVKVSETVGPGQYKLKPFIGDYDGAHKDDKDILYV